MRHGVRALVCAPDGPPIGTGADAGDLIGSAFSTGAELVVVPADRFTDDFYALRTKLAGEILQKFVNYRIRLAIVGDISARVAASAALRDFVTESNRGRQLWFVDDLAGLDRRLAATV